MSGKQDHENSILYKFLQTHVGSENTLTSASIFQSPRRGWLDKGNFKLTIPKVWIKIKTEYCIIIFLFLG